MGGAVTTDEVVEPTEPPALRDRREVWLVVAAVVIVCVPLVVAVVRAIADGWYPVGDNAFFSLRARDVLTEHHPLLGSWSSATLNSAGDAQINHPGPLLFDWLAVPARIAPAGGVVVGTALLHAVIVGLTALFGFRRGVAAGVVAAAMQAALLWTMGSDLLVEPWPPHVMLPAFLCFLVLVWALRCGDLWALPAAVVVGSLLVQTHLSYAPLVALLGLFGVVSLAWALRRSPEPVEGEHAAPRRWWSALGRAGAIAGVLAVVLWVQPIAEQIDQGDDGNLTNVVGNASGGEDDERIGLGGSSRLVAATTALPPWWARPSFGETLDTGDTFLDHPDELDDVPSAGAAVVGLVVVATVLGLAWVLARRRDDRPAREAVVVAGVALVVVLATLAIIPIGALGFSPHQVRWLWPIAIFTTGAALLGLLRTRWLLPVGALAVLVLAGLNLPAHRQGTGQSAGPIADAEAMPAMRELGPQLDVLDGGGPYLIEIVGLRLFEPYTSPLMLELQRRGVPFVVDHPWTLRQLGEGRRFTGDVDGVLRIVDGPEATQAHPTAERVAFAPETDEHPAVAVFLLPLDDRTDPP